MRGLRKAKSIVPEVNTSGIYLDNELRIKAYTGKINNIYVWVIQCILIFCASYFPIMSFVQGFKLNIDLLVLTSITIGVIVLNYIAFKLLKEKDRSFMAIGIVVVYVVCFIAKTDKIGSELMHIVSKYLDQINYQYNFDYVLVLNSNGKYKDSVDNVVLIVLLFVIMVVTYNVVMGFNKLVYFMSTILWPVLCLAVGITPHGLSFCLYVCASVLLVYINKTIHNYKLDNDEVRNKKGKTLFKDIVMVKVCMSLFIAYMVILLVIGIVCNRNKFDKLPLFKNLSIQMHTLGENIVNRITGKEIVESNLSFTDLFKNRDVLGNGKISESGSVSFENEKMFTAVSNRITDCIYLKNYIGFNYNNGWLADIKETDLAFSKEYESLLTNTLEKIESYEIREQLTYDMLCIKELDVEGAIDLIPSAPSVNYSIQKDGTLKYKNRKSDMVVTGYEIEYATIYALAKKYNLLDEINTDKEINVPFYTEVPEQLEDVIKDISFRVDQYVDVACRESELVEEYGEYGKQLEIIRAIVNYFGREYKYTLSPGKPVEGVDRVEYFLKYSKKGYCMYYAAAATALLRHYGIPTRYVEGYIIDDKDLEKSKEVDNLDYSSKIINMDSEHYDFEAESIYEYGVKDKNGHAWVEVLLGGIGWVPVEVTSSRLADEIYADDNDSLTPPQTEEPDATEKPDDDKDSDTSEEKDDENEATEEPTPTIEPSVEPTSQPDKSGKGSKEKLEKVDKKNESFAQSEIFWIITYIVIILFTGFVVMMCIKASKHKKHVDKYKQLIAKDKMAYMKYVLGYIWIKKEISYKPTTKYNEVANMLASTYSKYSSNDIEQILNLMLQREYAKDGITDEEEKKIIEFFNYIVDEYTSNFKGRALKNECLVKNYIQKI